MNNQEIANKPAGATSTIAARSKMGPVWLLSLALISMSIIVLLASQEARASPIGAPVGDLTSQQSQQQAGDYNNLENLISELLDDAGNRLKKSKLSSMRQIKQTLRFGRRSDPLMAPTFGERIELNGNANDHEQRKLLALYEE